MAGFYKVRPKGAPDDKQIGMVYAKSEKRAQAAFAQVVFEVVKATPKDLLLFSHGGAPIIDDTGTLTDEDLKIVTNAAMVTEPTLGGPLADVATAEAPAHTEDDEPLF